MFEEWGAHGFCLFCGLCLFLIGFVAATKEACNTYLEGFQDGVKRGFDAAQKGSEKDGK